MSGKQVTVAVLIMGVSVLAASAAAQDEKNEVRASLALLSSATKAFTAQTRPPSILLFAPATGSPSKSTTRADLLGTQVYAISVEVLFLILMRTSSPMAISFPPITHRFLSLPRSA
jgi:hypothetical protein